MKGSWLSWNDDLDFSLTEEDLNLQMMERRPFASSGIFGVVELSQFMLDMEQRSLLERLRKRGYRRFRPQLEHGDQFTERLRLWADHPDCSEPSLLLDVRSHRGQLQTPWGGAYDVLSWDWLEMRDPQARPSPHRPLLPGQEVPGLGLFHSMTRLMLDYVRCLEVQALVAVPEYFHNAVLYGSAFCFILPEVQGRFEAMCRDLLHEGLAAASWWVERGEVDRVEGSQRTRFKWQPDKVIRPLSGELCDRLRSPDYQSARQRALERIRFEHRTP